MDLSLSSDTSICSALAFHCLGNFNHVVVSVSIDFPSHSKGGDSFHHAAYVYFYADWYGHVVTDEMFHGGIPL